MSEAGGMIPHHLFTKAMTSHLAEVEWADMRERDRLIRHIRSLPPAERRIYLCSDEEAFVLSAADRRDLMVESNAESEALFSALLRRESWREVLAWASLLAVAGILAMMSGGLVQVSAALDQARAEGLLPLPSEYQVALQRIKEIGAVKFTDMPLAELQQRVEMPRQMLEVWQRLEVSDAASPADKNKREQVRISGVGMFLYAVNVPNPRVQQRGVDLLADLFASPEKRGQILDDLCRENRTLQK
ncbi:hypothetical protein ABNQ39_14945 [Azospirillum sp. A26]|uniref:hypothetical protein n=1 Tax=Azospirillum sp. A26 TaxID=3160607 RepID=UPI00366B98E0